MRLRSSLKTGRVRLKPAPTRRFVTSVGIATSLGPALRRTIRGLALLSALSLAPAGCGNAPPAPGADVITIGVLTSPNNLDPRVGTDLTSQRVHQLIFSNLLSLDDDLHVAPGLATSWETPDDRTYILRLRHGVRFHDGHEMTSADVAYTFTSLMDPQFVSAKKGAYRSLASVTTRDPYTVVFTLTEPFGSFLGNLVIPIVPAGAGPELRDRPVGTGPYAFVSSAADDRLF